jgi:hypothetical protein
MHGPTNIKNTLHVSDGLSVRHQESKTVHTASGIRHTSSVAISFWGTSSESAISLDMIYDMI